MFSVAFDNHLLVHFSHYIINDFHFVIVRTRQRCQKIYPMDNIISYLQKVMLNIVVAICICLETTIRWLGVFHLLRKYASITYYLELLALHL